MEDEAEPIQPEATTTDPEDHDALLDIRDEHNAVLEALDPPDGVLAQDYAEHLADVYGAVLEAAGFTIAEEAVPLTNADRLTIIENLSADDLIALVRGENLPTGHKYLRAIRGAAAA